MISSETYKTLSKKFGHLSSWALWDDSNISNFEILNPINFEGISSLLRPDIVLVALNVSASLPPGSFANFHATKTDASRRPLEKLRCALEGTMASGAYITDIIKYRNRNEEIFENSNSTSVQKTLTNNPDLLRFNLDIFDQELKSLNIKNKILIALGGTAEKYLKKYRKKFPNTSGDLTKIYHYSYRFNDFHKTAKYKSHVEMQLSQFQDYK